MELNSYFVMTVAAIGIGVAIVMSFYVFKVVPPNPFKYLGYLVKSLIAVLTVALVLSGIGLLGTSLIAYLRQGSVLPELVGFAVILVAIGAGLARFIGFGIMFDDDVDLEDA